ncbi:MAG TPA: tetratricopeptide repeat protein [Gemmatimonadales bacterium]|nr:tetratricopeptide repeat protein [Gemmatimonadales bacterium]
MESFTTRDVARLLGLTESQVRAQARAGFLSPRRGPRNGFRFSFQDLVLLRTARELAQARVSSRRIRNALCGLARQLPTGRSLTEIKITPYGQGLLVHDGDSAWNPESGQLQMEFAAAELANSPAPQPRSLRPVMHRPRSTQAAWDWFDLALELEDADPAAAVRAYGEALSQDPTLIDAHVNLGRLLQLAGQIEQAIEHYRLSVKAAGADPTPAFNLGTALEQLGRWNEALTAYRRALATDGCFADAHFNIARLYEQLGRRTEAIRHLRVYKRLVE